MQSYDQMHIIDKYETVIAYLYPIAQNIQRHKLLRKDSVVRAKRKIARYVRHAQPKTLSQFIASWRGHAAHADTCNLFNHLESRYGIRCHQHP